MPDTYTPILRPGWNERQVIQNFGGLAPFLETEREMELRPVVEVASEEDLDQLGPFREASEEILIDLPEYYSNRSTKLTDSINQTLERYGNREEFFRKNATEIDAPTVSSFAERPVEYGIHISMQMALQETFPRIAHRLMIRVQRDGFDEGQMNTLREMARIARTDSDVILFDIVDVGYREGGPLDDHLDFLSATFRDYETGLLNVFDAVDDQPENHTPDLADRFGCDSFGDFAIDRRFPPDGGGRPPVVYLRHYYPNNGYVEEFDGQDYDEAATDLVEWDDYEADHCEYCRQAARAVDQNDTADPSLWKRIRMGHYIETTLRGQI